MGLSFLKTSITQRKPAAAELLRGNQNIQRPTGRCQLENHFQLLCEKFWYWIKTSALTLFSVCCRSFTTEQIILNLKQTEWSDLKHDALTVRHCEVELKEHKLKLIIIVSSGGVLASTEQGCSLTVRQRWSSRDLIENRETTAIKVKKPKICRLQKNKDPKVM